VATELSEQRGAAVLMYAATQQRRWERGLLWLACIICATQFLSLPAGVCGHVSDALDPWVYSDQFKGAIFLDSFRTAVSLGATVCAALFVINRQWAHRGLILCSWLMVVFCVIATLYSMRELSPYRFDPSDRHNPMHETIAQKAADLMLWCYPLLLLSAVLERRGGTGRKWSASAIWSFTAFAALVIALPAVVAWLTGLESTYIHSASGIADDFTNDIWWDKVVALGMTACAIASFGTFIAVVWTYFRGTSGRRWLIGCTAFWAVYAAAVFGTALCVGLYHIDYRYRYGVLSSLSEAASDLRRLAGFLAFPLAIGVALTLSDVRARLEGKVG